MVLCPVMIDRKSTRLNSSHLVISYAVFCLKKKSVDRKSTRLNSSHLVISYAVFCFEKTRSKPRNCPPLKQNECATWATCPLPTHLTSSQRRFHAPYQTIQPSVAEPKPESPRSRSNPDSPPVEPPQCGRRSTPASHTPLCPSIPRR